MSESLGRAVLELVADLNPLKAQLAEGEAAANKMAASSARSFKSGISKAALPAAAVLGVVAIGLHKAVDAAQEDQVQTARLAAAYKSAGLDFHKYSGSVEEAVQRSAALGFQSADTKDAMGTLVVATHDHKKALDLLSTAQDIARFKHVGLAQASKILAMTMAGSTRAAHMLGIQTQSVTTAQDKVKAAFAKHSGAAYTAALADAKATDKQATMAKTIDIVNQKLHGQADAYAKTAAGAKDKLGAETTLLEENLGNALLPALTAVTGGLAEATGWLTRHATVAKIAIGVIAGLAAVILAVNIALELQATYTKLAAAAQWLWNAAMEANPLGLVVIALAALGFALVMAWKKSATFRAIVLAVWGSLKSSVMAVLGFFTKAIPHAFESVLNWVKGHWKLIAVLIAGPFAPLVALATNAFGVRSALTGALRATWNFAKGLWHGLAGVWSAAWNGAWSAIKSVINLMIGGINALIGAWDALHFHFGGVSVFGHHFGSFDVGVPQIPKIPGLAEGGIVTKPTLAMIGERGAEAVVPLTGKHMGGTNEFHFHGFVGNERDIAIKFGRELQKLQARGVNFGLATA